jgi:Ca2+-transporting ATPase
MIDPPRDEAKDAVDRARRAGVRPVMITGDHPRTAVVIARELGISGNDRVISGADLERLDDGALDAAVAEYPSMPASTPRTSSASYRRFSGAGRSSA